jgi:hypothetical protein
VTTLTAVADSFVEVRPARRSGRARGVAIIVSIGVAQAAWWAMLGWALWTLIL